MDITTVDVVQEAAVVEIADPDEPYYVCEIMPEFQGGEAAYNEFVKNNLQTPSGQNITGKVYARFIVNKTGGIEKQEIIKGLSPAHDSAVLQLIQSMPQWIPGTQNGQPVNVYLVKAFSFE